MNYTCDLFKEAITESLITGFVSYSLCKLLALFGVCCLYLQDKKIKQ